MHAILTPYFGRDYKNAAEAKAAWENGQDWILKTGVSPISRWYGKPCSIRDILYLKDYGVTSVCLRFKSNGEVIDIRL